MLRPLWFRLCAVVDQIPLCLTQPASRLPCNFHLFHAGQAGGCGCLEMSHGDVQCPSGALCNGAAWMNGQPLHCFLYESQQWYCPTLIPQLLGNWIPHCGDAQRRGRERDAQKECEIGGSATEHAAQPTTALFLEPLLPLWVCLSTLFHCNQHSEKRSAHWELLQKSQWEL